MPTWGTRWRSSGEGLAVPMSNPRKTCRESALMIVAPCASAIAIAIADFPAAVGPQTTGSLTTTKTAVQLVPRESDDRRASVYVMGRECRARKSAEERLHL